MTPKGNRDGGTPSEVSIHDRRHQQEGHSQESRRDDKQGEEGCGKTKKGPKEGEKGARWHGRKEDALPSIGTSLEENAPNKDGKVEGVQCLGEDG